MDQQAATDEAAILAAIEDAIVEGAREWDAYAMPATEAQLSLLQSEEFRLIVPARKALARIKEIRGYYTLPTHPQETKFQSDVP